MVLQRLYSLPARVRVPLALLILGVLMAGWVWLSRLDFARPGRSLKTAVRLAESQGDDWCLGDRRLKNKAYGSRQIRQPCVDDLNLLCAKEIKARWHKDRLTAEDFLGDRELSDWAYDRYLGHYATRERLGHIPTDEDKARIWNGGPDGWKKASTNKYWTERVKPYLK